MRRNDLLELIAHVLRLQLSYLSKDQALAVADTILRTLEAARLSIRGADNAGSPQKRRYGMLMQPPRGPRSQERRQAF